MGQRQREQVQRGCAVGTVVLLAWLCRVLPLEGLPSGLREACGILRSLLYLSLFAGWGISLYNRTVHPQVRRLLLNVDLLMLFWILVRTLRFQLNTPPGMDRMLGYLYYAPMLGIPVLCVQLVLTVDRSERYRLSAWARMLWLPSAVLLELVLTNDLHQQVFRLQQPWNENYQYGWLFGLVVGWIVICILLAFGIIAHKSRNPRILRRLPLPAIPMVLLGGYAVLYGFHFPLIKQFLGDMTIVHCLMTAASLEGGLRCGLIQSNTGYEELLRVTSLAVQLVDRQGNVYCCSENGRMVDRRELQAAMHGTVQLDEHTLLRSAPVQGGYVMWQTDITELVENMERLKENRTELAERNYLEQQNYEVERKINALREKNRLYDLLQRARTPLPRPGGSRKPSGAFLLAAQPVPAEKNRAAPHLCGAVLSGCAGSEHGLPGFPRKGAAQRAVFFSSGASGLFSRFSSGISSLLMMVSICSSFFTSSLGKRLFTRWTTVLR